MKKANQNDLDFGQLYFSFREEEGRFFHRAFVERGCFFPFGELLEGTWSDAVTVLVRGEAEPVLAELNELFAGRLDQLAEAFASALRSYVDQIGVQDFAERIEAVSGYGVRVADPSQQGGSRELSGEEVLALWKKGELHRVSELQEVSYVPSNGHLGLLFRVEWEQWLSDQSFAVLMEGERVMDGIDQTYEAFCREDATGWFAREADDS